MSGSTHWSGLASRWDAIGPPLRPGPKDVAVLVEVAAALPGHGPRCLVLGATSELVRAAWPAGTDLLAVDRSAAMVDALWEASAPAVLGDWRSMPVATASIDLAVCDGGWHLLDPVSGQPALADELARVVRPDGCVAVRVFAPAAGAGDVTAALDLLGTGDVVDANHLKVLLWMAVRADDGSVAVHDVWRALTDAHPDLEALADDLGWPPATLRAFDAYRGSPDRYHLMDEAALIAQLEGTGSFELASVIEGAVLAPDLRFPTVVLRRLP